ncbi:gamma-glutamyl kinase [Pelagovum pacificum]|uniref:Gamma-glutamyl kinase n=1 Tax=Pelagovum pacificum TaxID=2588711 RepID=A0A5C5GAG6_9RHOB|nr:gamma-glutamyl kinase [Pelagovum pacificum]QQA41405.1 gamma-glutamyl kinase [Pelagovum pacificum]TNY31792.1 gamma-glutamyl kinase [Pelagovum pacificum]
MLVFWKEKLVFLAVPKTGTTALEGALAPRASIVLRDPPELKHSAVYRYNRWLDPFFEKAGGQKMETLAVVRHPVDWLGSWFRYRSREDLIGHPNSTRDMDFDDFVNDFCRGTQPPHAAVGSQAKFLLKPDGSLGVDHLFQYEQQDKLVAFLEDRLGGTIEMKRLNVSPAMELEISPKMEEKFRRKRPEEFDVWEMGARS